MTATMIKFLCNGCQERLSVPERFAGRKGACPNCKTINRVPLRGFPENQTAATARPASESSAVVRANGNGAAHINGNGKGTATLTPPGLSDLRGRIQPAVPPIEVPPARMRSIIDPPPANIKVSEPAREPVNGNGTYVHPLVEAVNAPATDWSDPAPPSAAENETTVVTALRGHGVLAPDEYTPGERWKRAWEEPKPSLSKKILSAVLPRRTKSDVSRPGGRALDDGFSMPLKVGMLLGGVAGLVGMIYLVLYFLLWSHLNMTP